MKPKLLSTLVAGLFVATPAFAGDDDPMRVQGTATLGAIYNNQNAADTAKLEEYQDLGNGALSNVGARGRNSTTWFDGYGENFGRTDQFMYVRGGMYDIFKVGAYLNDMPHNFSTSARTPFVGVGGNVLVAAFPQINPATWNGFNLGYERRDAGGYVEWQKNSPWYFRADGNQVSFSGAKVGSGANGTSPGNGFVDLAIPTQYKTSNWGAEGGYQTSKATASLRWDYSKFDNSNETLQWTNPFFGGNLLDTTYLPPDNTFNKFTASANYRDLPWRSVISARYTWSETKSSADLGQFALNSGPAYAPTLPSENTFNGKNVNQAFALGWTAAPMTNVDTRVYYYWTKLANRSDVVEYGNAPAQPLTGGLGCGTVGLTTVVGNCENDLYNYTKNNVGFDLWWRFARGQKLGFGYDYNNLDQTRVDYDKSHWSKLWVEYKNTMLDTISGRLKYQYLKRDSTLNYSNAGLTANNPAYLSSYTSAFDLQSSTTNQVKLYLDYNPLPLLGFSFEGTWAKQDYDNVTYGRTGSDRQGYFLTGNWGEAGKLILSAFGSWEETKYGSDHRYIGTVAGGPTPPPGFCTTANPNCYSPTATPNAGSYNWNSSTKDQTYMIGAGLDWPVSPTLMVKASYLYVQNNGAASFSSQDATGQMVAGPAGFGNPLNIGNFDDSKQQSLNVKGIYAYNQNWSFTAGYAYEKYNHNDIGTDGYQYGLPYPAVATNTNLSYLNGYDAFTNGHQNIFYLTVTYKFDAPPLPVSPLASFGATK
ncbi:MAG: MtrB/PioB family outer membrane beta-barrel protein [Betaproteobacteria bacterium]